MSRSLALVLATPEARGDFARVHALARAARAAGVEVSLFMMDAGVEFAVDARAAELVEDGCDLVACGTSVALHLGGLALPAGIVGGSQDDHAAIVSRSDRTVAFT